MGKEALWVWELTFLNGQNLSRVKGFKPNNPLRGIMDRTQTSVHVLILKNMKVGLKNLYTENIIKYYYKNENNMKSTTLLL